MVYQAVAKNDRLKRFSILNMSDPGRGKEVIADNIRKESTAVLLSAAPELLEALECLDAALSGANMDMRVVEKKVKTVIAKARGELPPTPHES